MGQSPFEPTQLLVHKMELKITVVVFGKRPSEHPLGCTKVGRVWRVLGVQRHRNTGIYSMLRTSLPPVLLLS